MAQTIQIKRSTATAAPSSLEQGELAYSDDSKKLFIGKAADGTIITIGGDLFTDMLDHTLGTLTASSAILVDSDSKIDQLKTANLTVDSNSITSSSGNLNLIVATGSSLDIDSGTIDIATQATELKIIDGSSTAFTISEGTNNYITLDTTNSAEQIVFNKEVSLSGNYTLPTTDGTNGQALITNGSGVVSFGPVSTVLNFADDASNTSSITQLTETFTFSEGEGLNVVVGDQRVTFSAELASASNLGVASFDSTDFTVTSGAVSVNTITLGTSSLNAGESTLSLNGLEQLTVDDLELNGNTISTTLANTNIELTPNGTGTVVVPSGYKNRAGFGTNSLVTKEYVDALKQALDIKESVRAATTADIGGTYVNANGTLTNSGALAAIGVDGVALAQDDRVLVKNQTNGEENGIYTVTTVGDGTSVNWVLTRSADANIAAELTGGVFTFVEEGTTNADNGFVFTHEGTPTFGTTNLTVSQFSGAGQIIEGNSISKNGNTIQVIADDITIDATTSLNIKGITTTAIGDILIGAASDGGYTRLVKPSADATASDYILSMTTAGVASWANILDGGTF